MMEGNNKHTHTSKQAEKYRGEETKTQEDMHIIIRLPTHINESMKVLWEGMLETKPKLMISISSQRFT